MKRLITLFCIALGLALYQISVNAQPAQEPGPPPPSAASFPNIDRVPLPSTGNPPGWVAAPKRESRVIKKGILAPAESDVTAHQFLLSQKKTGIMRLLPRDIYDSQRFNVAKRVDLRGGGAYYSFHYLSHEYGYGSDISYEHGYLIAGGFAGADYGFLTDLGDTPLEPIVATDPRAAFSFNYTAPRKEYEARIEQRKFRFVFAHNGDTGGVTVDGVLYRKNLPMKVNHTYLLRSISYDKSDLLVALRVVSISDDGGLTIAWKILKEFTPTKLLRVVHVRDLSNCAPKCK